MEESESDNSLRNTLRTFAKNWSDFITSIAGLITSIAVILTAGFAGCQYRGSLKVEKINRTMEYIQRYEDGNVATARRSINDSIRKYEFQNERLPELPNTEDYHSNLEKMIKDGDPKESEIDIVVDFYEGMFVCVKNTVCDKSVALSYFDGDESGNFYKHFEIYIANRRKNNACYAEGLIWFAPSDKPKTPCKQKQ